MFGVAVIPEPVWSGRAADEGAMLARLVAAKARGLGDWCCSSSWCSGHDCAGVVVWVRRAGERQIRPKFAADLAGGLRWACEELERAAESAG